MPTASFDVFDTLLTRVWAEPRDLFLALGHVLHDRGLTPKSPAEIASLRQAAEEARRSTRPSREITLQEIHEEFAAHLGWSEIERDTAIDAEITLESASIRPVPGRQAVVQAARLQGARVVFLSDMYLPSALIRQWLAEAGFYQPGDLLLVSGEARTGKGSGGLFRVAQQQLAAGNDWLHTGDHARADVAAPRALGFKAVLNQSVHLGRHEKFLRGPERYAPAWRSQLAGAARLARLDAPADLDARQKSLWEVGATVAGPFFLGFTRWCLDEAARRNLGDLYFLARGGQIFLRIAEMLPKPTALRCHYLHTSRVAFAGIFDGEDMRRLRELAAPSLAHHSVRQALVNLGQDPNQVSLPPRWPQARWDETLPREERPALADWLLSGERLAAVRSALQARAARARDYLQGSGLQADRPMGIVDTGWMGTIQKNIEHLLGAGRDPVPVHGFYLGLNPAKEFSCHGDMLGYTNAFRRLSLRRETTHLILLEIMARGDHGPLLGFVREQDRVVPQHGSLDAAQREEIILFQSAVLAFVRRAADAGLAWPDHATAAPVLIENYLDFFRHPTLAESGAFSVIPHSDQMMEQRHSTLCRRMSLREVLRGVSSFPDRPPGWWLAAQARFGHAPLLRTYMLVKKIKWAIQSRLTGQPD